MGRAASARSARLARRATTAAAREPRRAQLIEIGRLIDGGHLRPIVSAVLPLAEGRATYGARLNGRGPGKTVLLLAGLSSPTGATGASESDVAVGRNGVERECHAS